MPLNFPIPLLPRVPDFLRFHHALDLCLRPAAEHRSMVQLLERLVSRPIGESVQITNLSRLDKTLARLHMDGVLFYNEPKGRVQLWSEGSKLGIQRFLATQNQTETVRQNPPVLLRTGTRAL